MYRHNLKKITITVLFLSILSFVLSYKFDVSAQTVYIDQTFGDNGRIIIDNPIKDADTFYPRQIEQAFGGGYVVASYIKSTNGDYDLVMCKVTELGGMDTSFGSNGCLTVGGSGNDYLSSFVKTKSGKYLLVGYSWSGGAVDENMYLVMVNSNGTLDTSFDGDGQLFIGEENDSEQLAYAAIEVGTGSFIIVGTTREGSVGGRDAFVTKINSSGAIDSSFGVNGELMFGSWKDENMRSIVSSGNGEYILAGNEGWGGQDRNFHFAKITESGEMVATFGTNGESNIDIVDDEYGENLIKLSNGKYVLQGYGESAGSNYGFLVSINEDGSLNTAFNSTGYMQFPSDIALSDVLEDNNSHILVVGDKIVDSVENVFVQRFNFNGSQDTTFRNGYSYITAGLQYGRSLCFNSSTNSIVIGGYFQNYNGTFDTAIIKLTNGYQISGLGTSIGVTSQGNDIKYGSEFGLFGQDKFILTKDGYTIFEGDINLTKDVNWVNFNIILDFNSNKTLIDPNGSLGVSGADYIYVPKNNKDNFVVICPNVTTAGEITKDCSDGTIIHENSILGEVVNNNGRAFWKIEVSNSKVGGYSYSEDDSSIPVTITQMHKFTDIPDYHDIEFYSTSKWVYIKGITEPQATVTFITDTQKFTTTSSTNGDFAIKIDINKGIAHIDVDYYSTSKLGVNSVFKNLKLHIGCETFPNDLYATYCSTSQKKVDLLKDEKEDSGYQVIEDDGNDIFDDPLLDNQNDSETIKNYDQITTKKIVLQFFDVKGDPITSKEILIDGEKYTTSGVGQIELEIGKDAQEINITYDDGGTQKITLGDASFINIRRQTDLNNLPLLILVVLIPSIIVTIISIKVANILQKRN